jgi:hypothetical protein
MMCEPSQLVRDDLAVRLEALDGDDDDGPEFRGDEEVAGNVSTPSQLPEIARVGEGQNPEMARDLHGFAHQGLQLHGVERLELLEEDAGAVRPQISVEQEVLGAELVPYGASARGTLEGGRRGPGGENGGERKRDFHEGEILLDATAFTPVKSATRSSRPAADAAPTFPAVLRRRRERARRTMRRRRS